MNVAEFTTAARSRIEDADFAAESARLAKAQVLQQTGTAMLAQANAQPQLALSLIRVRRYELGRKYQCCLLNAQRSLAASGAELKTAMERLSSGKKINSAADDAAGFAIVERMTAQIRGLNVATKNANDGLSMLAVIENATDDVTDMLQRIRELAVQASNDTNSSVDRAFLQEEVSQLVQEIDRVGTQTPVQRSGSTGWEFQNKSIQVGTEAGQTVSASVESIRSGELGQIENLSYLGDLAAEEASNIAYALENNPDPWMFTVYLADSAIELQRGDVIKFGTDASSHSYIVDSAHSEDGKYR